VKQTVVGVLFYEKVNELVRDRVSMVYGTMCIMGRGAVVVCRSLVVGSGPTLVVDTRLHNFDRKSRIDISIIYSHTHQE
jgi:hypothetical protein